MKRLLTLLSMLLLPCLPLPAQTPPEWKQAPTEVSLQGLVAQDSTSHLWQGILYASMGSYVAPKTLVGGTGSLLWANGQNGYLLGPTISIAYPLGLKDWDLIVSGDANAPLGDAANAINWQAVTRLGLRFHLGTQGSSIQPGIVVKRAFGVDQSQGGKSYDSAGLYLTISLGIQPQAAP